MVGEEGLGRGAAESVHGGVDPVGALCGLGELLEEEDHCGREGAGGLGSEQASAQKTSGVQLYTGGAAIAAPLARVYAISVRTLK